MLRLDDLGSDSQAFVQDQNGRVIGRSVLVSARGNGDKLIRKVLDSFGASGVGSDHHGEVVLFEESGQVVGAKAHDVVLLLRIPHLVLLETIFIFILMWVAPYEVDHSLMVFRLIVTTKFNLKRSWDLLDLLNICDCWSDSTMAAENSLLLVIDNGC